MSLEKEPITSKQKLLNLTLVGVVSQVGCLTLVIILAALFLGLFLDSRFNTRPWFTIGLVLVSIPVSLVLMLTIVRAAVKKLKPETTKNPKQEEHNLGE
jgi:ABC-type molybdate transport system permease subunit